MTNKFCDSPIHKVSSLALAFIILAICVLPVFASADEVEPSPSPSPIRPNPPIGYKDGDTFRDIMLAVLDSWGISFSKSDPDDDTSILELSDQLMQEFYEANQTTQELFWDLVKYGASETGDLILDFLGVNKIRQFANWLVDKFSLTDNTQTPTSPAPPPISASAYLGPYPVYELPLEFIVSSTKRMYFSGTPVYGYFETSLTNSQNFPYRFALYLFTPNPNITVTAVEYSGNNTFTNTLPLNYHAPSGYYTRSGYDYVTATSLRTNTPPDSRYYFNSELFSNVMSQNYTITTPSYHPSITIVTQVINIPSEDLGPDDGLQISIPGTNWGDSIYSILDLIERLIGLYDNTQLEIVSIVETLETLLSNLQHSVTVENIPGAVILDYDDYDIPIENEWGLFDIFFNTGGDEITLLRPWQELRAIIYGFPAPVLSFFALVVLFIVAYGFIRMGRDSH